MPRCHLNQELVNQLLYHGQKEKMKRYLDDELKNFILEFRNTGSGTWFYAHEPAPGRRRFIRLGRLRDMSAFEARLRAYEIYLARQPDADGLSDRQNGELSFKNFVSDYYLPYAKTRKRSWELDKQMLCCHILPQFSQTGLHSFTRLKILNWQNQLRECGLRPSSCNRIFYLLQSIFNCAVRWGLLSEKDNPCRNVSPLPETERRERFLSEEEARKLLTALRRRAGQPVSQILQLLLFTGARKSEIMCARWEDVDMESRLLTVPLSKSGRTRHIPLSDYAIKVLQGIPRTGPWLFPSRRKPGHISSINNQWNRIRKEVGLEDVRIHDLRHSFASFLVNSGCSLYEVQKILGHHDPRMTMRYAHLAPGPLIQAANLAGKKIMA